MRRASPSAAASPASPSTSTANSSPPEAGERVGRPERLAQAAPDGGEELVADGVAQALVDDLEAVEVEQEDGQRRGVVGAGPAERVRDPVHEQRAVRQAGQGVVERLAGEALLDRPAAPGCRGWRSRAPAPRRGRGSSARSARPRPRTPSARRATVSNGVSLSTASWSARAARADSGKSSSTGAPSTSSGARPNSSANAVLTSRTRPSRWITSASNEASARRRRRSVLARSSSSERVRGRELGPGRGVEPGVLEGHGGELGEAAEAGHVGLVEDAARVAGGEADHADDVQAGGQRHADDRADPSQAGQPGGMARPGVVVLDAHRPRRMPTPGRRRPRRGSISKPSTPRKMPRPTASRRRVRVAVDQVEVAVRRPGQRRRPGDDRLEQLVRVVATHQGRGRLVDRREVLGAAPGARRRRSRRGTCGARPSPGRARRPRA